MTNSDSDTEEECFESAEESIDEDEDEKNNVNTKCKTSLTECRNKFPEPVESKSDTSSSVPQVSQDVAGNSLSYRKRPERLKRQNSQPLNKTTYKSSDDLALKTDKIVPDVFLQEITSNLSKNINKSLSTLHQKSSNVKDMIFNSLTVSSVNENEGFSYDDKSQCFTSADLYDDIITPDSAGDVADTVMKEEEEESDEKIISETNFSCTSGQNVNEGDRNIQNELCNLESNICNSEELDNSEVDNKNDINTEENILEENISDEKEEQVLKKPTDFLTSEIAPAVETEPTPNDQSNTECEEEVLPDISQTSQDENHTQISSQIDENEEIPEVKETSDNEFKTEKSEADLQTKCDNSSSEEISSVAFKNTHVNENLITINKHESSDISKARADIIPDLNLKELKTALKSIITKDTKDTKNIKDTKDPKNTKNIKDTKDFKSTKDTKDTRDTKDTKDTDIKEEVTSNEGWDDFDFSDIEEENLEDNQDSVESIPSKEKELLNSTKKFSHAENVRIESLKSNKSKFSRTDSKDTTLVSHKNENVKPKIPENKSASGDAWGDSWGDDWGVDDEEMESNEEVTNKEKSEAYMSEKSKNTSADLSNWSGWENFGQKPEAKAENQGFGFWAVDALLNKATAVTQGISNVLEAGLGAPDPETLARMEKNARQNSKMEGRTEPEKEPGDVFRKSSLASENLFPVSGLTNLVAGVTSKIVEHSKIQEIGSKVLTGGLDTLETFGKKTMEVLQEGDPGLKNKRALLLGDRKPVLSQVLKEAREEAERENKISEERNWAKMCNFENLFDDSKGLLNLDALNIMAKDFELNIQCLRKNYEDKDEFDDIVKEVETLCSLSKSKKVLDSSKLEFKLKLQKAFDALSYDISFDNVIQAQEEASNWIKASSENKPPVNAIYPKLVSTLAQLSAAAVKAFYVTAVVMGTQENRETVEEVEALSRFTYIMCSEIKEVCEKFMSLSKDSSYQGVSEDISILTKNVPELIEKSTSYINEAYDLMLPNLQFGAISAYIQDD